MTHPNPPIISDFLSMTPDKLGPVFNRVLFCTRKAAEIYAPGSHQFFVLRDPVTHARLGYRLLTPDRLTASRIAICYELARQCKPMPWVAPSVDGGTS